jgi:hypothetical protein
MMENKKANEIAADPECWGMYTHCILTHSYNIFMCMHIALTHTVTVYFHMYAHSMLIATLKRLIYRELS